MQIRYIISFVLVLLMISVVNHGSAAAMQAAYESSATAETVAVESEAAGENEVPEPVFPEFDPGKFDDSTNIDNEWFPMQPGTFWAYEGTTVDEGEEISHRIEFTVTDLTKEIEGVQTIVAWIVDISDGEVVEKEIGFYAQDNDGNVWYLGEHPEEYEDGEFIAAPTWIAGVEEARPGIKMVPDPGLGAPVYFQGWAPAVEWSDFGIVAAVGQKTCVPVDCYENALVIDESSLDEENAFQVKHYAKGVGNIRVGWKGEDATQEELELVEFAQLEPDALAEVRAQARALGENAYKVSADVYGDTKPAERMR